MVKFVDFTEVVQFNWWNYSLPGVGFHRQLACGIGQTSKSRSMLFSEMDRSNEGEIAGQKPVWHNKLEGMICNFKTRWDAGYGSDPVACHLINVFVHQWVEIKTSDGMTRRFGVYPVTLRIPNNNGKVMLTYSIHDVNQPFLTNPYSMDSILVYASLTNTGFCTMSCPVANLVPGSRQWTLSELVHYLEDNVGGEIMFTQSQSFTDRLPDSWRVSPELTLPDPPGFPPVKWAKLARQAYDTVGMFDGNGIAFLKDLMEMKSAVSATKSSISQIAAGDHQKLLKKNHLNPKQSRTKKLFFKAKAISNLYLSFHYGWRLLASDTREIVKELNKTRHLLAKCQSGEQGTYNGYHYTCVYSCYYEFLGQLTGDLEKFTTLMDLNPDLSNAWDMVPYSFVVDWFTNIGDTLQSVDNWMTMYQKHKVLASIQSTRLQRDLDLGDVGGNVAHIYYERRVSPYPVVPEFDLQVQPVNPSHIAEGTALVVSAY